MSAPGASPAKRLRDRRRMLAFRTGGRRKPISRFMMLSILANMKSSGPPGCTELHIVESLGEMCGSSGVFSNSIFGLLSTTPCDVRENCYDSSNLHSHSVDLSCDIAEGAPSGLVAAELTLSASPYTACHGRGSPSVFLSTVPIRYSLKVDGASACGSLSGESQVCRNSAEVSESFASTEEAATSVYEDMPSSRYMPGANCRRPGKGSRTALDALRSAAEFVQNHVCLLDGFLRISGHEGANGSNRKRDVFPLMLLQESAVVVDSSLSMEEKSVAVALANGVIVGLNALYGFPAGTATMKASSSQASVHFNVLANCSAVVRNTRDQHNVMDNSRALAHLVGASDHCLASSSQPLLAEKFDLLEASGCVDPMPCLNSVDRDRILNSMFADAPPGVGKFPGIKHQHREEYAKLVVKQLQCGKVRLESSIQGGGTVFSVGKKDSQKLREVWHGAKVSASAAVPPKPPHLPSPSALLDLECCAGSPYLMSKRDGRCLFDQLKLPKQLQQWMGRPPVRVRELIKTGLMSLEGLKTYTPPGCHFQEHTLLYPVSCVWPMGFSWSSFIAQSKMLQVCNDAGLTLDSILSDDLPTPSDLSRVFALATDDVMHFQRGSHEQCAAEMHKLDKAFVDNGVLKHE